MTDNEDHVVYVVTYGEYSDYCIQAVYTDGKKADELVAKLNKGAPISEYRVEVWMVDKPERGEL